MDKIEFEFRWSVIPYITEEVRRQGHDPDTLDGIERVAYMTTAWAKALEWKDLYAYPSLNQILLLGALVEPTKNKTGFREIGVCVGNRVCPPAETIKPDLINLLGHADHIEPIEFYKNFELIHPFIDGNGRTGKILLNWVNDTLLTPIFPPADLFGHPIVNP